MSHQIKQITSIQIQSLVLLGQAVSQIEIPSLGTFLWLDTDKKSARYYNGNRDTCDAVITYGRELTQEEQCSNYEIAVKRAIEKVDGVDTTVYHLYADTYDMSMGEKIATVFEEYIMSDLSETAMTQGAFEAQEVYEAGEFAIPDGYRCMKLSYHN